MSESEQLLILFDLPHLNNELDFSSDFLVENEPDPHYKHQEHDYDVLIDVTYNVVFRRDQRKQVSRICCIECDRE